MAGRHFIRSIADYRTVATGAPDSNTINAAWLDAIPPIDLAAGNVAADNVNVRARFTQNTKSCKIVFVATTVDDELIGVSDEIQLDGGAQLDGGGLYLAPMYVFPSYGARYGRILVTTPPDAGSVKLSVEAY